MKTKILKTSLGSLIFLFLVIGVFALIRPVYIRMSDFLSFELQKKVKAINETIGISIAYESLSPSVLAGINIKGITVSDSKSKKQLLKVERATFSYKISDFFSKNAIQGIKKLVLDGVTVEFDTIESNSSFENIKNFFIGDSQAKKNDRDAEGSKRSKSFNLAETKFNIPFDIQFRNIRFHYNDLKNDFILVVKNILLLKNSSSDSFVIKTSGRIDFRTDYLKTGDYRFLVAFGFDFSGTIFNDWEGSSFMVKFGEISQADFTLGKLDFLIKYSDSNVSLRTMRTSLPYALLCEANLKNQQISLEGSAKKFEPLKLVKMRKKNPLYEKFEKINFSGTVNASSSFYGMDEFLEKLNFSFEGQCSLPKKILGSEVKFDYDFFSKNQTIFARHFTAEGKNLSMDFSGSYDIKTKQPTGVFTLNRFALNNGGIMQTEIYIEPYKNGFMCFAPQLFMDNQTLTALDFKILPSGNSVDFSFEFDDYSHSDYDSSAHVKIEGSYLNEANSVVQASLVASDVFLDSVLKNVAFFLPKETSQKLKDAAQSVENYIFSDEIYFTTDFKSFSFNSPYFILANTKNEREFLTFSLDGSKDTLNLSSLNLQYGEQTANASLGIDFLNGFEDFNFFTQLTLNSLPYNFSGSYTSSFLSVSGDYNFSTAISFEKLISGSIEFSSFPFYAGEHLFSSSAMASFAYSKTSGFSVEINRFDIEEAVSSLRIKPHLVFTGSANRYGFVMNSLAYSDTSSALDGKMNVVWSFNDGIFDSIILDLTAKSLVTSEAVNLNMQLKNPEKKSFSLENLKNDFYISSQGFLKSFPASRLLSDQNSDNTLNAEFSLSGTLINPFLTLNVARSSVNFAGYPVTFSLNALYDDSSLTVSDFTASWASFKISDFFAIFEPKTYTGEISARLLGEFADLDFNIPLKSQVASLSPDKNPYENFYVTLNSDKMSGTLFPTAAKLDLILTKDKNGFNIVSEQGKGIVASITNDGIINAKSGEISPIGFDMTGSVVSNNLDLSIKNIRSDLKKLSQTISIPYVNFTGGTLSGAVRLTGLTTDPEYTGAVTITKPEFYVPYVSKKIFKTEKLFATAGQNHFIVKPTQFSLGNEPVSVGLDIEFDRWGISYLDCPIETKQGDFIPVDILLPLVRYKGYAGFENFLIRVTPELASFTGKITGENADIEIPNSLMDEEAPSSSLEYFVDLNLQVKNRVQLLFNPLLRGVITPDNSLQLFIDTRTGDFSTKGEVTLRGGEIAWLNRNFYMKQGKVVFNESKEIFDPKITVRAETRERDENNNQITIIMSADSQALSRFNPRFSSTPARSEKQIMELLGNVLSADSENVASLAVAGGDYLMQATVMRSVENALRELLNFDIFSIRTNILQNAVKQSFNRNSSNKQITFGNFFDNSAVYVGKYFGSALYVDALMHWNYDETKVGDNDSVNGLVFQPEFGIEMASPYVNIRLGVSPDLEAIKKSFWMPSTSITLSWKHSF
ncbi:translocation/assembly module TamB domain-containing protein [Treponema pectinovorum]|uniref:translocation/assembly module TamB domain-containing protein n=1 Tax=Treponema pectinovorum TaxID=164 RepID=UPI0011C93DE7|nr:translocation/assembly module TamB domain-containing protein [Treponema pectinovorum]